MQAKGLKTVLVGPIGPFAPGGQPLKHGPRRRQISGHEIRLGAGGPQGDQAGKHHPRRKDQGPGEGRMGHGGGDAAAAAGVKLFSRLR